MKKDVFISIVEKENLQKPILTAKPINQINSYGCYTENGFYYSYRTDEKAYIFVEEKFKTEDEALDVLLKWLRNKKIIDNFLK